MSATRRDSIQAQQNRSKVKKSQVVTPKLNSSYVNMTHNPRTNGNGNREDSFFSASNRKKPVMNKKNSTTYNGTAEGADVSGVTNS